MTRAVNYKQVPVWLLKPGTRRVSYKATKPVRIPIKRPACFTEHQWGLYRVPAQISATNGYNYCQDCTPEYRDQMVAERRCAWPQTQFVTVNKIIIGKRARATNG